MTALELAIMFLKDRGKIALSEKQAKWLMDVRKAEGNWPYTGCLGETDSGIVFFKEAKTYHAAYGGGMGTKGTGRFFLQLNPKA